jgi:hypothetical protein
MTKKTLIVIFGFYCTLYGLFAVPAAGDTPVFKNEIVRSKDIFKCNSVIPVKLKLNYPEKFIFRGLGINAYIYDVPKAFVKQNEAKIRKNRIAKWSSIPIRWINILKKTEQKGREYTCMLDINGWPAGSYMLYFTAMFRPLEKGKKEKYVSSNFIFTIED